MISRFLKKYDQFHWRRVIGFIFFSIYTKCFKCCYAKFFKIFKFLLSYNLLTFHTNIYIRIYFYDSFTSKNIGKTLNKV